MDWFKALQIGSTVVMGLLNASVDGRITTKEILDIGVEAAKALGYNIDETGIDVPVER